MDVFEITTPRGEVRVLGKAHGAINALVSSNEGEWFFKQFLTMEMLENFALDHNLVIVKEQEE